MQEFQKLITPGHVAGHRARAALMPFYAPACVAYGAGIVLAVCAISGVGGSTLAMPAWFDRAFTADEAVYQRAAEAKAEAAMKAAQDRAEAERKAAEAKALAASSATASAPVVASASSPAAIPAPAAPAAPAAYTPSPVLLKAIAQINAMHPPKTPAEGVQSSIEIDALVTNVVNGDRAISDRVASGYSSCSKQADAMGEKAVAEAPNHIAPPEAQLRQLDYSRTCVGALLNSLTEKE